MPAPDPLWWADPELKARIQTNPAAVLAERGVNVPGNMPAAVLMDVLRVVSVIWQDGRVIPLEQFRLDPADEGLLFGRGVWESTKTINSVPWLWAEHLHRLNETAALLDIRIPPAGLPNSKAVSQFVRLLSHQDVVIRLNVTAGRPGRTGTVWMSAALRPAPKGAVRLKSQRNVVPANQPYLQWKTFQYASRLRTGQEAARSGPFDSALMLNDRDELLEASHANIFVRFEDGWVTPPLDAGPMLPGTVRNYMLTSSPLAIQERPVRLAELDQAREVFLTNSNVGLVPVVQIDGHSFPVGPETQQLLKWVTDGENTRAEPA